MDGRRSKGRMSTIVVDKNKWQPGDDASLSILCRPSMVRHGFDRCRTAVATFTFYHLQRCTKRNHAFSFSMALPPTKCLQKCRKRTLFHESHTQGRTCTQRWSNSCLGTSPRQTQRQKKIQRHFHRTTALPDKLLWYRQTSSRLCKKVMLARASFGAS